MVPDSRLRLSPAPTDELAAAAMAARADAGAKDGEAVDFIVVAVEAGHGEPIRAAVEAAALAAMP